MRRITKRFSLGCQRGMQIWLLSALFMCLLSAIAAVAVAAADIQVTAKLEPARFAEDQAARFIITVIGAGSAQPETPVADGLRFGYPSQSNQSSIQIINGRISSNDIISFVFTVQAEKTGTHTIGPVNVTIDEKVYTTQPVTCNVLPVGKNTASLGKKIGFLRIMPETERMYSGQVVPFAVRFYVQPGMEEAIQKLSSLKFVGDNFLQYSLDKRAKQRQEHFNGEIFTTLTWQGTLSAVKEGRFPLTMEMNVEVLVPSKKRHRRNPFGSSLFEGLFLSDILGNYTRRDIKISSPEKKISVLDLPTEKRPDDFSGAIGTFSLAVAASPLDGKVGDPITLKMQLNGSGNFALVQAPSLMEDKGWKVYPASGTVQDLGGGKGEKSFEQALIPTEQGLTVIPPVRFSYFDPKAEEYVTLTSDPVSLSLQPADEQTISPTGTPATPVPQTVQQGGEKDASPSNPASQPARHLAPLKPELGELAPTIQTLYEKLWFQLLIAAGVLCLLAALVLHLRQRRLARDPSILRRKEVQGRLAEHYEGMRKALAVEDQEAFHQHCRAAIQERTGEVWGLAPETVTLADLEQRLPDESSLRSVFVRLEQSGYAGEQLAPADLEEILQTTRNELDTLA